MFFEQLITAQQQHQCSLVMFPTQHGFIKRRSTSTNLFEFTSVIRSALRIIIKCMSFLQTSVRISILWTINYYWKLTLLGLFITLTKWILTYLLNRTQRLALKSSISKLVHVTSDVPQKAT